MKLNYHIILIGFIAALSAYFINFFGFIIGGLVVGYLIRDDYNNAAINGAIACLSAGLILNITVIILWTNFFINNNGAGIIYALIFMIGNVVAGLGLGGIGGIGGIFIREQIETQNN